jgi:hypothetical protein
MACARSPSRGFAAHLVLHSPFPAAARPQGRILSIALQQVGDDKHTAGGGGRLVDVDQVTSRCFFQGEARVRHDGAILFLQKPPRKWIGSQTHVHRESITCGGRHHRKYSHPAHPSKEPLSPIVCGGTLAAARCRSLTRSAAHTARTRETPCRWRRGGMCTARSPSARTTADLPCPPFS